MAHKFTITELATATFPIEAYEVRLQAKSGGQKGVNCAIYPVQLTGLYKEREVRFVTQEGHEGTINPVVFHRSVAEASRHASSIYGEKATVMIPVMKVETLQD